MTEKKKLLKAGIGFTIGNFLLKGIAFITTPIFARLMTTADYGKYNVFMSYESILFVFIGLAIHSSYKNAYYKFRDLNNPDDERGYQKYVSVTMWFLFISLAFWMMVALILNKPIAGILGVDSVLVYVLVASSFVSAIINCYTADKGIHFQYREILIISFAGTIISIVLSLVLMQTVFHDRMYLGRIIGGFIPGLCIYSVIAFRYVARASGRGMKKALFWGIKYSLPIVPHGISQVILTQFDRIMILRMINESKAGIYSFAYTIYSMIAVASASIDGIWSPWFYKKRKAEDYQAIKDGSMLYILVMLLVCIGVIMLGPELIQILGGDKYRDAVYCAVPIVCGGYFACIYNIPCLVEYYHEKTKLIAASTAIAAVLNIVLNAVFIPLYGYVAAAYTTLFTYAIYFLTHYFSAMRIEKRDLFPRRQIALTVVILLICAAVALLTVHRPLIRMAALLICLGLIAYYEEKHYSYIRTFIRTKRMPNT